MYFQVLMTSCGKKKFVAQLFRSSRVRAACIRGHGFSATRSIGGRSHTNPSVAEK